MEVFSRYHGRAGETGGDECLSAAGNFVGDASGPAGIDRDWRKHRYERIKIEPIKSERTQELDRLVAFRPLK